MFTETDIFFIWILLLGLAWPIIFVILHYMSGEDWSPAKNPTPDVEGVWESLGWGMVIFMIFIVIALIFAGPIK
jgi:uncharacterized SAM-binding protein YcdF (DUF218 family)